MAIIPYGKQDIQQSDIDAVVEVLKADFLTQGPKIEEFEIAFAKYVGAKYAVAVANGTAALHLNAMVLGVGPGTKVITTPITFAASANCVRYCGGEVVFADIDPETYLLDINKVRALLEASPKGTYSGIIPVDFAGRAVDLESFRQLADEYSLWIIEDSCHSPGGFFIDSKGEKQHCGNGKFADLAIFSFHPVKHIAAGEGGMITTNNPDYYNALKELRTHGITRDKEKFENSPSTAAGRPEGVEDYPGWYMEMQELGYNYRLTDFQSALGLSQLERAATGLKRRRTLAERYAAAFDACEDILGQSGFHNGHAYHLYIIEVEQRLELYNYLRTQDIYTQVHYIPLYLMPYYGSRILVSDFPNANKYYSACLSLPMFPQLKDEEQDRIIDLIINFLKDAETKVIIEVANTHGGNPDYLKRLIKSFEKYGEGYAIKFQPLHPDGLATKDFEWYEVYQKLFFKEEIWKDIIAEAATTKEVWLDIFDEYGLQIFEANTSLVGGLKLQVSVLYNRTVLKALSKLDLSKHKLIINIASLDMEEIQEFVTYFKEHTNPTEFYLEVGFQAYPTELTDSGLSKIAQVKEAFGYPVVFADHINGEDEYALWLPSLALAAGADIIEKHVMLSAEETEYDAFSSLTPERFHKMNKILQNTLSLKNSDFINDREKAYLQKSLLKPILKVDKKGGDLVDIDADFEYRRSGQEGLNILEIEKKLQNFQLLEKDKPNGATIEEADFKKAKIAAIVACRLKSSRLEQKALLKIGSLPSVELCLKNVLTFARVDEVILATSTEPQDAELEAHTYSPKVIFHRGDPDDVVQRYLDIVRSNNIDVIVRVTGDMPYVSDEICDFLLRAHFDSGSDYTTANRAAVGTNLEIINTKALERVKRHFPKADYSEYMTWYFQNNPNHFKLNFVDLPADLVAEHRLTIDYEEDLEMFNEIEKALGPEKSLKEIIHFLDQNPNIAALNGHLKLKYKTDQSLIDTLNRITKISS